LAGQGAELTQARITHDLGSGEAPAVQLLRAELVAIDLRVVPEGPAHELARRGAFIAWAY